MRMLTSMLWLSFGLFLVNLLVKKVGQIFVESEVLKQGNTQLLDNLEEGVIILEDQTFETVFINEAAKKFQLGRSTNDSTR